jgi:hypothetical protein
MSKGELEILGFDLSDCAGCQNVATPRTSNLKRWLAVAWVIAPVLLSGLGIGATVKHMEKAIAASTPTVITPPTINVSSEPRVLKLQVTLSQPEDLKVKQGDVVKKDQVISDRTRERERLLVEKSSYNNSIERLQIAAIAPLPPRPVPKVLDLPAIAYAQEVADINHKILKVKEADEKVNLQQRKIDVLGTFDEKDLPASVGIHETQHLAKLQADAEQAKADQELAEGKFQKAKDDRAYLEYKHSETIAKYEQEQNTIQAAYQKAQAEFSKQEQERSFQLATLQGKRAEIETQLKDLSTVRSPYAGQIKRLKVASQSDNKLTVDLVLVVARAAARPIK